MKAKCAHKLSGCQWTRSTVVLGACYTLVGGWRTIAASLTFIASGEPPVVMECGGLLFGVEQYIVSPGMWPCRTEASILGVFLPAILSMSLFSLEQNEIKSYFNSSSYPTKLTYGIYCLFYQFIKSTCLIVILIKKIFQMKMTN